MGMPVYCRWTDAHVPDMHGRWLPGTVHSCRRIDDCAAASAFKVNVDNGGSGSGMNMPSCYYSYHMEEEGGRRTLLSR